MAIRGAQVPPGVLEDSLMGSTTKQDGRTGPSGPQGDSERREKRDREQPRTASGAYLGLDREAVVLQSTEYPGTSVVVMDRTLDPHTGIVVEEAVPVLSQQESDSQMQKAVSQAQKERSNPDSPQPESATAEERDTRREDRDTQGAPTPAPKPQSPTGPTGSTGSSPTGSTSPKPQG
jgi:hypothetical protein